MKTILSITVALLLSCIASQAQNAFFPTTAGVTMLYAHQDAKGKTTSHVRHTIKDVEGSGMNLTISYVMEIFDKNMKPQSEVPCTVIIKDNVVFLDMKQMFTDQMKTSDLKVEVTGIPMELPGNLQPGQPLKDANMTLTIDAGILKMRTDMKMTDGRCEAIENVTVRAGTFTCHKITQTETVTVMRKEVVAITTTWYAPGIGTVKTETRNNKNAITRSSELISLEYEAK